MDWSNAEMLQGFIGGCLATVGLLVVAWLGTIIHLARADRNARRS